MEVDLAIELIDQTASDDLLRCQDAIRSGDTEAALEALGQAVARLGVARDSLQGLPRQPHDVGLHAMVY